MTWQATNGSYIYKPGCCKVCTTGDVLVVGPQLEYTTCGNTVLHDATEVHVQLAHTVQH
jgi:hypothetical protein